MQMTCRSLSLAIVGALVTVAAFAQEPKKADPMPAMPGMTTDQHGPAGASSAADQEMMTGMAKMNRGMSAAPMTGDADRDFVEMMVPHHQGAVDMAEAELKYGKDPLLRQLAHAIIAAQKKEIAQMQRWQAQHDTPK